MSHITHNIHNLFRALYQELEQAGESVEVNLPDPDNFTKVHSNVYWKIAGVAVHYLEHQNKIPPTRIQVEEMIENYAKTIQDDWDRSSRHFNTSFKMPLMTDIPLHDPDGYQCISDLFCHNLNPARQSAMIQQLKDWGYCVTQDPVSQAYFILVDLSQYLPASYFNSDDENVD